MERSLFDSPSMTFAHYEFDAGSGSTSTSIPKKRSRQVIEGELEIAIGGDVPSGPVLASSESFRQHAAFGVKAISSGKAIIVDYPLRPQNDATSRSMSPR